MQYVLLRANDPIPIKIGINDVYGESGPAVELLRSTD